MPEGDTVWQAARRLDDALAGDVLTRSDLRVPRLATVDLRGRTVLEVVPRGKHLLARFEGGLTLHSHLRMDGAWQVYAPGERWRGGPGHQIRAVLATERRTAVGYRLPVLELLRTAEERRVVGHLGPDLLGPDWDAEEARRRLLAPGGLARPLGEALLDQRTMAGVGNVYMAELCFLARATPWLPVGELPDPDELIATAHRLLAENRERVARTTTPAGARTRERLYVYGRAGRPCLRCGAAVAGASATWGASPGRERPVAWCPGCQKGPGPGGYGGTSQAL